MKTNLEKFPTSPAAIRMLDTVTKGWYDNSYVGKWIYQVMGSEIDEIQKIADGLKDQIFAETATWGIIYHEMKYGIPFDSAKELDERRRAVITKRDHANKMPWTPFFVKNMIWNAFSVNAELIDKDTPFTATLNVLIGENESTGDPRKILAYICKTKPSHIEIDIICTVETIVLQKYEKIYLEQLFMQHNHTNASLFELKQVDFQAAVDNKKTERFFGKVKSYKFMNKWDGTYKFDGTIKFNSEVREEVLEMEAKLTKSGKEKLLRSRAGEITMPKIVGFAFGTGGVNASGIIQPVGDSLSAEFLRKAVDNYSIDLEAGKAQYFCTLGADEAVGKIISEIGLYDSEGDIIMISNFLGKGKDEGLVMRFEIDDVV